MTAVFGPLTTGEGRNSGGSRRQLEQRDGFLSWTVFPGSKHLIRIDRGGRLKKGSWFPFFRSYHWGVGFFFRRRRSRVPLSERAGFPACSDIEVLRIGRKVRISFFWLLSPIWELGLPTGRRLENFVFRDYFRNRSGGDGVESANLGVTSKCR